MYQSVQTMRRPQFDLPSYSSPFSVVTILGSAGAVGAMINILRELPPDFPAALAVVQHRGDEKPNRLTELIRRNIVLSVETAETGMELQPRTVYVAPSNHHLGLGEDGRWLLSSAAALETRGNPHSGDALFTSAAQARPAGVVGVVLSGMLADGSAGVQAIKASGGVVIAQDPATAQWPSMPRNAISTGCVDFILPDRLISRALVALMVPGGADFFTVPVAPWVRFPKATAGASMN